MADVKVFGGRGAEHHSEAETFSITSVGVANMTVEALTLTKTTCTPGEVFNNLNVLASYKIKNNGNKPESSYLKHLVWDPTIKAWKVLETYYTDLGIAPDGTLGIRFPWGVTTTWTCPAHSTKTYFAVKVWGKETETEPADPAAPT
jgi:hypothetical protein